MSKLLTLLALSTALVACQSNTTSEEGDVKDAVQTEKEVVQQHEPAPETERCFRFIAQRDTYDIRINREGNLVNGTMHFNNFEKDDSRGTFSGLYVKDNVIKTIYRFESEGMKSVREIFLRDDGDQLVTGIGEEVVQGDSAYVKNADGLEFTAITYKKVDCSEIP